ncbi:hypothetical protein [Pseudovibrio denitrificans]|nr:hypothetical protein [Pseudovibrio denitrificans]
MTITPDEARILPLSDMTALQLRLHLGTSEYEPVRRQWFYP